VRFFFEFHTLEDGADAGLVGFKVPIIMIEFIEEHVGFCML
jgi:hypothetical protein